MARLSTVNAIPTMTSNTAPSGIASASSVYGSSNDAWYAFDKKSGTASQWSPTNGITTGWISYNFNKKIIIAKYSIVGASDATASPKDWTFEGSNDGNNWTVLDTQVNVPIGVSEYKSFTFTNTTPFNTYRLNITANNGRSNLLAVGELEMFELIPERKLIFRNFTIKNHYSLDNKTLVHLPSSSDKNMILHGIESGKEIKLDEDFDKMKYVKDTSEVLGNGKVFTHAVDMSNTKIKKLIL